MQVAVNAVESFKRARLVDSVTLDDDKIAPIYKLDEVCELLKASSSDVSREVVQYLVKSRLEHRSPFVKLKALRLIKYLIPKAGKEFKREIQRHSALVRNLFQYKGQPDPLRGDAPNKAVRDTAHETMETLFHQEEAKMNYDDYPMQEKKKMEGFGNSISDFPSHVSGRPGGSSAFTSVVDLGSEHLMAGFDLIREAADQVSKGALGRPGLRRSLRGNGNSGVSVDSQYVAPRDVESNGHTGYQDMQERQEPSRSGQSGSAAFASSSAEERGSKVWPHEVSHGGQSERQEAWEPAGAEERLVETLAQSGGVRVQPSREALASFVTSIRGLSGENIGAALMGKLRCPAWQARMKALCALEAILRNEGDPTCDAVYNFFVEDSSSLLLCMESPQASVRDKAKRVFHLLGLAEAPLDQSAPTRTTHSEPQTPPSSHLPDLLDTTEPIETLPPLAATPLPSDSTALPDFLGSEPDLGSASAEPKAEPERETDPFAGLSVHDSSTDPLSHLLSGLSVDSSAPAVATHGASLFEGLSLGSTEQSSSAPADIMAAFSSASPATLPQANAFPNGLVGMQPFMGFQSLPLLQQQQFLQQQMLLTQMQAMRAHGFQNLSTVPGFSQSVPQGREYSTPLSDSFAQPTSQQPTFSPSGNNADRLSAFDFVQDHLRASKQKEKSVHR